MLSKRKPPELVICESDIDAALEHLQSLPYRRQQPRSWDRQHLLNRIREVIGKRPEGDKYYRVGARLYAIIQPFGIDSMLSDQNDSNGQLQVCLLIKTGGTDPSRVTIL